MEFRLTTGQDIINCLEYIDENYFDWGTISREENISPREVKQQFDNWITKAKNLIPSIFENGQICNPSKWCPIKAEKVLYIVNPKMLRFADLEDYYIDTGRPFNEVTEYYDLYCYPLELR